MKKSLAYAKSSRLLLLRQVWNKSKVTVLFNYLLKYGTGLMITVAFQCLCVDFVGVVEQEESGEANAIKFILPTDEV